MHLPPCSHRPPCPGCPRYGEGGLDADALAALGRLATAAGVALDPVIEGEPLGFRVRARLAVRGRAGSPKLGIFQEGSHRIVDIPSCTIHHAAVNDAARAIRDAVRRAGITPYADRPHRGLLRYVQVVVERPSGRVQVALVANDDDEASILPLAAELEPLLGRRLQGLWWNGHPERSNAVFGDRWKLLAGDEAVRERIGGADVFFPPGAFGQSNLDLADLLVDDVHARVPASAVVADLYCGVGAFGLGLAARGHEVRFNERGPGGLRGLELGLEALPSPARARTEVIGGDAGEVAGLAAGADVVILDPPRRGLDGALLETLVADPPSRLLYVSCDPDSLARDAARLLADGRLRLHGLRPYALFPNTRHVETLAEFRV